MYKQLIKVRIETKINQKYTETYFQKAIISHTRSENVILFLILYTSRQKSKKQYKNIAELVVILSSTSVIVPWPCCCPSTSFPSRVIALQVHHLHAKGFLPGRARRQRVRRQVVLVLELERLGFRGLALLGQHLADGRRLVLVVTVAAHVHRTSEGRPAEIIVIVVLLG